LRHHLAALVAQQAQLVEVASVAFGDEAAVAGDERQLGRQRAGEAVDQRGVLAEIAQGVGDEHRRQRRQPPTPTLLSACRRARKGGGGSKRRGQRRTIHSPPPLRGRVRVGGRR